MKAQDTTSTVLVDATALARSLGCVHRDFTIIEFLDLCTAIEAIVLNDRICILDSTPDLVCSHHEVNLLADNDLLIFRDSGVKLADGGPVLKTFRTRMSSLTESGMLPGTALGKSTFGDAFREATVVSEAEKTLQISALPLRRFACFYEPKVLAREEHTACDLLTNYEILSQDLRDSRRLYRYPLASYITAEIPPLPIIALQRAASRERLLEVVLELRDEYSKLRTSLSALRTALSDDEVTPRDKQKRLRSWAKSWKTLDKYGPPTQLAVANTTQSAIDVDRSVDGQFLDLNLNKLLGWVASSAREVWCSWRVRILHDAAKQYLKTSDSLIHKETKRLFGHELTGDDLKQLDQWDKEMMAIVDSSSADRGTIH